MMQFSVLLVTDPSYEATGREYGAEDVWLAEQLRGEFVVSTASPRDAEAVMDDVDVVLVRNTGPVMHYQAAYESFRAHARRAHTRLITDLGAKADAQGKQYLLDLHRDGAPVIPTISSSAQLGDLQGHKQLIMKPMLGADSVGMRVLTAEHVPSDITGFLLQPYLDIEYEVSYVYVDHAFQYATRTGASRWDLHEFVPTADELTFAHFFIDWNDVVHGVQRVDACRTTDGQLLLVELEDLNPYLSLDRVSDGSRTKFARALTNSIHVLAQHPR